MYTILLIEDDNLLATVLKDFFEASKLFTVLHVADGEEAIALYEKKHPHVLLIDVMLPKKNGFEIISEIRKNDSYTPIILMTGTEVGTESEIKGYRLGAVNYLKKPVIPQAILAQIETLLHLSSGVECYTMDDYRITIRNTLVTINDSSFRLRETDARVLSILLSNPNTVVSRPYIQWMVWHDDKYETNNLLDSSVSRIRKILGRYPDILIEQVYAKGCILLKK